MNFESLYYIYMIKTNKLLTLKFFIFNGKKNLIRGMRFVLACLCFFLSLPTFVLFPV